MRHKTIIIKARVPWCTRSNRDRHGVPSFGNKKRHVWACLMYRLFDSLGVVILAAKYDLRLLA